METGNRDGVSMGHERIKRRILGIIFPRSIFCGRVGAFLLLLSVFLLPLFFISESFLPSAYAKAALFQASVLLSAFILIGSYLREQTISLPRSHILYASWLVAVFFILAGAFSPVPRVSFFGMNGEVGTTVMSLLSFGGILISALLFATASRLRSLIFTFSASASVLILFQVLRILAPGTLSGMLTPLGSLGDLAIFMGGLLIVALAALYFYVEKKSARMFGYSGVTVGLLMLSAIDFRYSWIVLSVILGLWLAIIVGHIAQVLRMIDDRRTRFAAYCIAVRRAPRSALLVFIVALLFSFGAGSIPFGSLSAVSLARSITHISKTEEARPTPRDTFLVATNVLRESPFFGAGPNRFSEVFARYGNSPQHQASVSENAYNQGFGYIPTFVVTTGLIGLLFLLYFILSVLVASRFLRAAFSLERSVAFLVTTLFVLSVFFLAFIIIYTPGVAAYALTFIFIGAFVAAEREAGLIKDVYISNKYTRQNATITLLATVKIIALILIGVVLARMGVAYGHFYRGQLAVTRGELVLAHKEIIAAHARFPTDAYARDISVLALLDLNTAMHGAAAANESTKRKALDFARAASVAADEAVRLDPTQSKNYIQRGAVYEAISALGATDALSIAREAYARALLADPTSIEIMYALGRTELAGGNESAAINWFSKVLERKPSHPGALLALVGIRERANDYDSARTLLQAAIAADPTDSYAAFTLGKIYYNQLSFAEAAKFFAAALRANPQYADARFYLAASAFRAGDKELALKQFKIVSESNPNHELLNQIISAIEQGNDPFVEDPYGTPNN